MTTRVVLQINLDKDIYDLYYSRYYHEKATNHNLTHNDLIKILLGLR